MSLPIEETELYRLLKDSDNPISTFLNDPRLLSDVWTVEEDLPSLAEQAHVRARKSLYFEAIPLQWLKDLLKLSIILFTSNRRWSLGHIIRICCGVTHFGKWLFDQGYFLPSTLNAHVVQKWIQNEEPKEAAALVSWLRTLRKLGILQIEISFSREGGDTQRRKIPEKVKHQIDLSLNQLDKPIFTLLKLHEALATRSIEIAKLELDCLRRREGIAKIRIRTGKQSNSEKEQDLPEELVPLVHAQQEFIRRQFGSEFPWLFSHWTLRRSCAKVWPPSFEYHPEQIKGVTRKINKLLENLIAANNICYSDGNLAHVTSHDFRRLYATVADAMGKRPDQIQHGLRHLNSDMQDPYVQVSPEVQEKRIERILVNKDGKSFVYLTDQHTEFLRIEWKVRQIELGVCSRPKIIEDCEFEYVCLGCEFFRAALEHLPKLLEVRQANQQLLEKALVNEQSNSRRANSARQMIEVLNPIIDGLQKRSTSELIAIDTEK